jgi:TAG lipase/steryl ester hydrolase/phospholipase A2/LPA acyltransferase
MHVSHPLTLRFHLGVIQHMIQQNCLPEVISGSSGGSIVTAFMGLHTDDELMHLLQSNICDLHPPHRWMQEFCDQMRLLWHAGHIIDGDKFDATLQAYFGAWTFAEAYRRTGREINICITLSKGVDENASDHPLLMNHLSTPNVLIYSAVKASCSLPGLADPATVWEKRRNGASVPYQGHAKFVDGSLTADIPRGRLKEVLLVVNAEHCQC